MNGNDEMVAIDTTQPSLPPPAQTGVSEISTEAPAPAANGSANGNGNGEHSHPPAVKSHKGVYGRASDFLSNTSNWQVGSVSRRHVSMELTMVRSLNPLFEVSTQDGDQNGGQMS